jgi:TfoX/Sxy family transcriptional regulator of competence genes
VEENNMASTKEYLDFVMEQLSGLDEVSSRAMMGEYILYYRGRIFGGVYDDRLLVKPVPMALRLMPRWNSRIMALKK